MKKCRGFQALARACAAVVMPLLAMDFTSRAATLPFAFSPPGDYAVGRSPSAVVVADFNGDNEQDLTGFWTEGQGALTCFPGQGNGAFATPGSNYNSFPTRYGAPGDFNRDGLMDLVTVDANFPFARILLGRGNGTFSNPTTVFLTGTPFNTVTGDFNGDGKLDAAVSLPTAVGVLLGNGTGGLASFTNSSTGYDGGITFPTSMASGDFDGDGKLDFACVAAATNVVAVLIGNGNGTFRGPAHYTVGEAPSHVALADLNCDGRLDIVTANAGAGTVSIRLGNGDGTFASGPNVGAGGDAYAVAMADFNGDGLPDIASANRSQSTVGVLAGNGNGTFQAATNFLAGGNPVFVTAADFNGDGKPDLATANSFGDNLSVLVNQAATPQPRLFARPLAANRLQLSWPRFGTASFDLQATTNILSPSSWADVGVVPATSNEFYVLTITNTGAPHAFYRLRQP